MEAVMTNKKRIDSNRQGYRFNDFIRSDIKDTERVLATVVSTINDFFDNYNRAMVVARASTASRSLLSASINTLTTISNSEIYEFKF